MSKPEKDRSGCITATFTGPRRKSCKQKKPRGPRLRVQRIVITRFHHLIRRQRYLLVQALEVFVGFCVRRRFQYARLKYRKSLNSIRNSHMHKCSYQARDIVKPSVGGSENRILDKMKRLRISKRQKSVATARLYRRPQFPLDVPVALTALAESNPMSENQPTPKQTGLKWRAI